MTKNQVLFKAFALAVEMGFFIALPLIGFGLLGKWLDSKWGTGYMVLVGIGVALVCSAILITRKLLEVKRGLEK